MSGPQELLDLIVLNAMSNSALPLLEFGSKYQIKEEAHSRLKKILSALT